MFFRVFLLFALVALAFANPKPEPQAIAYTGGAFPYSGFPYSYGSAYAAYPYAYGGYYLR